MKISKLGIIFSSLYIIFIGSLIVYVIFFSQLGIVIGGFVIQGTAAIPWIFLVPTSWMRLGYISFIMPVTLNIVITYLVGAGIQKIYSLLKKR